MLKVFQWSILLTTVPQGVSHGKFEAVVGAGPQWRNDPYLAHLVHLLPEITVAFEKWAGGNWHSAHRWTHRLNQSLPTSPKGQIRGGFLQGWWLASLLQVSFRKDRNLPKPTKSTFPVIKLKRVNFHELVRTLVRTTELKICTQPVSGS